MLLKSKGQRAKGRGKNDSSHIAYFPVLGEILSILNLMHSDALALRGVRNVIPETPTASFIVRPVREEAILKSILFGRRWGSPLKFTRP